MERDGQIRNPLVHFSVVAGGYGCSADGTDIVDSHIRFPDCPGALFEAKSDMFALFRKESRA
jgi:hypothetical protein